MEKEVLFFDYFGHASGSAALRGYCDQVNKLAEALAALKINTGKEAMTAYITGNIPAIMAAAQASLEKEIATLPELLRNGARQANPIKLNHLEPIFRAMDEEYKDWNQVCRQAGRPYTPPMNFITRSREGYQIDEEAIRGYFTTYKTEANANAVKLAEAAKTALNGLKTEMARIGFSQIIGQGRLLHLDPETGMYEINPNDFKFL